jgi:hypothetical protein
MIRPAGIDNGAFVVTPDSVCYAQFCSFSMPQTPGPNRLRVHSCRRWKHMMILRMVIIDIVDIIAIVVNLSVLLSLL